MAAVSSASSCNFRECQLKKIKNGVFDGPQIRQAIKDKQFTGTKSDLKKIAWLSFEDVVKNFLGNTRESNYTEIVQKLLESYKVLGYTLSIRLHYLRCHLAMQMYIWWLTIVGSSNAIFLKLKTPERVINVNFYLSCFHEIMITVAISFVKT